MKVLFSAEIDIEKGQRNICTLNKQVENENLNY